jgi:hypothetical protein
VDLLDRLNEYARENTLIYTTHLPFMIDLKHPERIRVVSESEQGPVVTESLNTEPDAKLVLQAALAIAGRTSYSAVEQNLVVEGIDDYWILTALSDLSLRSNKQGLPPDLLLTPSGGLDQLIYITTFMVGQNLEVVALFDTDKVATAARDQFDRNWLSRYRDQKASTLSFGPAVGLLDREFSIEDLFPEDFYISCVDEVYGRQLGTQRVNLKSLPRGDQLVKRVEKLFETASLPFNKTAVSKVLCKKIRGMKSVSELRSTTVSLIEVLFENIRKEFAAFQSR